MATALEQGGGVALSDGATQWVRASRLVIAGEDALDVSALRFQFDIKRKDTGAKNIAEVKIYNVALATANRLLAARDQALFLEAGYVQNHGLIFSGTVSKAAWGEAGDGVDMHVVLTVQDGQQAIDYCVVNKTLDRPTQDEQRLAVVQAMQAYGIGAGFAPASPQRRLPRGKPIFRLARECCFGIGRNTGSDWNVQDGALVFVSTDGHLPGNATLVSAATGLVGRPRLGDAEVRFDTLINPTIRPGGVVQLASVLMSRADRQPSWPGYYRVRHIAYKGDTHGKDWYGTVVATPIAFGDEAVP